MNLRKAKIQELTALMISPDRDMAEQFNETVSLSGAFQVIADLKTYPSHHSLEIRLRQLRPDVVLLDLASDRGVAADLLRCLTSNHLSVHVVGLSPTNDREILLNALRLGASEFLHAPFDGEHQTAAVSRLERLRQPDAGTESPLGVVTVFSNTKPGCGASTLALYAALALRRLTGKRVLLADLDLRGGIAGVQGHSTCENSILDAVDMASELSPAVWSSLVADLNGLDLLASPDLPFTGQLDSERLNAVLHFARTQYDYVLIDLPVVFDRSSLVAFSNSERAFLVSTPELPSLHLARRATQLLQQLGFPKDRFQILLNRVNRKEDISRTNIEKLFDCSVYCDFPNDFYSLNRALTSGQPLDSSSELSKAVNHLASTLAGSPELRIKRRVWEICSGRRRAITMFPNLDSRSPQQMTWEQRLVKNSTRSKSSLKPEYQELKFTLHRKLVDKINLEALASIDNQRVRGEVRQALITLIDAEPTLLSSLEKQQISDEVLDEVFGLGPLEPLLQDPSVSDILVNTHKHIYVERKGLLELTSVSFRDTQHLLRIIDKIVSQVGRRVDESTPMVDARLMDGSRVNAIIPPLAVDGPLLSIRRFSTDKLMPPDLVDRSAMTAGMMELLEAAVKAKLNVIIAGGTGAGKTTLLNALSAFISPKERIVTIEDAAELQLKQPHVVRLETRPANLEGSGAVRQRELLVNSLRMRPDRIVVGEVRGEEALDMLQAMNTGHDGSLTTVHANTPRDAISRLEVMVSLANSNMQLVSIRQQIASAVHLLVQAARLSDGSRRVMNVTEVTGMEGEVVTLQDIFVFEKRGLNADGAVVGRFAATGIRPKFSEKLLSAGIRLRPNLFDEVQEI